MISTMLNITNALVSFTLSSTPIYGWWTDGRSWGLAWSDRGTLRAVAGDVGDDSLMVQARDAAVSTAPWLPAWYPWLFPRPPAQPQPSPMQECFRAARETCAAQNETVCWAYFIPALQGACIFACRDAAGNCAPPPPIPPAFGQPSADVHPHLQAAGSAAAALIASGAWP